MLSLSHQQLVGYVEYFLTLAKQENIVSILFFQRVDLKDALEAKDCSVSKCYSMERKRQLGCYLT